jgi:hypothetical protein
MKIHNRFDSSADTSRQPNVNSKTDKMGDLSRLAYQLTPEAQNQ